MRIVFALTLVLGLGLAGFAVYMAQGYIDQVQQENIRLAEENKNAPQLVDVIVASRALNYGERITRADVQVVKWPAGFLPPGVFHRIVPPEGGEMDATTMFAKDETRPRAVLRGFEPFEPVLVIKVTEPGIDAGIAANLSPGLRAYTIQVDPVSGVSGFLRPGDRVDIYWTGRDGNSEVTQRIETAIRLIAIDQNTNADRLEESVLARSVTVEISPEQVAYLTQAQNTGNLTLSLVGVNDEGDIAAIRVDQDRLLGTVQAAPAAPVAAEKVCTIPTNKAGEVVLKVVPCTD